jgi:hypothetical protein
MAFSQTSTSATYRDNGTPRIVRRSPNADSVAGMGIDAFESAYWIAIAIAAPKARRRSSHPIAECLSSAS